MSVQVNNQASHWRKTPRITVVPSNRQKPEIGPITQRFFAEGEERAASGYKNLGVYHLDVDDSVAAAARDPELEFDSFDQVPKRQRPLVGIALVVSGVAVMVAAWTVSAMGVPWRWEATKSVVTAPAAATPAAIPAPAPQRPVVEPIRADPQAAPRAATTRVTPRALAAAAALRAGPRADPDDDSDDPAPEPGPDDADDPDPDSDVRVSHRSRPMRGYVWSPAAKAMVASEASTGLTAARGAEPEVAPAAGRAQSTAAATTAAGTTTAAASAPAAPGPAIAPAAGPGALPAAPKIAPADTGPPPFESARVPARVDRAPIIE